MRNRLFNMGCAALATLLTLPTASAQQGNGPVRQGVRGVAEGTAKVVRRTGEATRNVLRGTAEGTANAVRRTGEAARNLGENTRDRLRGENPRNDQAQMDNQNLNNQIDGQYQGQYESGYRGVEPNRADGYLNDQGQYDTQNQQDTQSRQSSGQLNQQSYQGLDQSNGQLNSAQVYQLRHDASGREFICMNGQRVYFNNQASYHEVQKVIGEKSEQRSHEYDAVPPVPQANEQSQKSANSVEQANDTERSQDLNAEATQENKSSQNQNDSQNPADRERSSEQDDARSEVERNADSLKKASDEAKESRK